MKNLIPLSLMISVLLTACMKDSLIEPKPKTNSAKTSGTITAIINKQMMSQAVQVLINHIPLNEQDTGINMIPFSGSISWGDETVDNFIDSAEGAVLHGHTYQSPGIYTITINLDKPNGMSSFTIQSNPDQLLSLSGLENIPGNLLKYIVLQNTQLTTIDISANTSLTSLFLRNNNFSTTAVNNILTALDNSGVQAGPWGVPYIDISHQQPLAAPSGLGSTAKLNLIAKGWTVITD